MLRAALLSFWFAAIPAALAATSQSSLPGADVSEGRFSAELPDPANYVFGTDWNFRAGKYQVIAPSYYYFGFRTAPGARPSAGVWPPIFTASAKKNESSKRAQMDTVALQIEGRVG